MTTKCSSVCVPLGRAGAACGGRKIRRRAHVVGRGRGAFSLGEHRVQCDRASGRVFFCLAVPLPSCARRAGLATAGRTTWCFRPRRVVYTTRTQSRGCFGNSRSMAFLTGAVPVFVTGARIPALTVKSPRLALPTVLKTRWRLPTGVPGCSRVGDRSWRRGPSISTRPRPATRTSDRGAVDPSLRAAAAARRTWKRRRFPE